MNASFSYSQDTRCFFHLEKKVRNENVLAPGIEPGIFEVKAQYDNHYTTQELRARRRVFFGYNAAAQHAG